LQNVLLHVSFGRPLPLLPSDGVHVIAVFAGLSSGIRTSRINNKQTELLHGAAASIGAPTNVRLRRTSSTALVVSWDPPQAAPSASLVGYRVYYSSYADYDLERWLSVEIGPFTVTELSGLQPHTVYAVRVRAKASDGQLGALSEVVVSNKLEHGQHNM